MSSPLPGASGAIVPVTYDSARLGSPVAREARALWRFRHLALELVRRDIKVRYKRSSLGVAWTMLSPLLNMLALTFAFATILRPQISNFAVYLLSGMLLWNFFSQATSHASSLTVDALEITKRMWVPRSVFVAAAIGGALVNLLFALVPLLAVVLLTGHPVRWTWLFLPVPILLGAAFTAGIAFIVFTLACRFIDVRETWAVLVQAGFFLTPIVYTSAIIPPRLQPLLALNPMTHLLAAFRSPIYEGVLPGPAVLGAALASAVVALVAGWLFYATRIDDYASAA